MCFGEGYAHLAMVSVGRPLRVIVRPAVARAVFALEVLLLRLVVLVVGRRSLLAAARLLAPPLLVVAFIFAWCEEVVEERAPLLLWYARVAVHQGGEDALGIGDARFRRPPQLGCEAEKP